VAENYEGARELMGEEPLGTWSRASFVDELRRRRQVSFPGAYYYVGKEVRHEEERGDEEESGEGTIAYTIRFSDAQVEYEGLAILEMKLEGGDWKVESFDLERVRVSIKGALSGNKPIS